MSVNTRSSSAGDVDRSVAAHEDSHRLLQAIAVPVITPARGFDGESRCLSRIDQVTSAITLAAVSTLQPIHLKCPRRSWLLRPAYPHFLLPTEAVAVCIQKPRRAPATFALASIGATNPVREKRFNTSATFAPRTSTRNQRAVGVALTRNALSLCVAPRLIGIAAAGAITLTRDALADVVDGVVGTTIAIVVLLRSAIAWIGKLRP